MAGKDVDRCLSPQKLPLSVVRSAGWIPAPATRRVFQILLFNQTKAAFKGVREV